MVVQSWMIIGGCILGILFILTMILTATYITFEDSIDNYFYSRKKRKKEGKPNNKEE